MIPGVGRPGRGSEPARPARPPPTSASEQWSAGPFPGEQGTGNVAGLMFGFLKRRSAETPQTPGTTCKWCRTVMPADQDEALFLAGAVLDPVAGWFCSSRCAGQYALRFRVQPPKRS